ncbi:amidohydrolase family protein [Desulfoluna spongiiphila]|uniref:Tat (Twin-arginine translocation) pathway signal sequence n=1 Tax=Desulfoluna spongiiphila TaxID=419481 RepID=A0A1G5CKY0_9BACT|nr:amidohydrolase family protein [Desulfoluna spongiiphila]SCY02957.1 Tat (twin-arginine translocation) pathway signal sequence [Desulfoluna spongiiphila]
MAKSPFINRLSRRDFLKSTSAAAIAGSMAATGCAGRKPVIIPDATGEPLPPRTLFGNGRLVSLPDGRVTPGWSLLIEDGRIVYAGPDKPFSGMEARRIDLAGEYLLPGLMDAHCHMTLPSAASFSPLLGPATWRQLRRNFENQLASGVTRVRDMGAMPPLLHTLVREVEKGELAGPDVITCNAIFNVDGGHPDITPSDVSWLAAMGSLFTGAPTVAFKEEELASAFEANCRNADFVKITLDNTSLIAGKPSINRYSDDALPAIFRLADAAGKPVAGHAMRRFGVRRALAYPIHSLEHTVSDGPLDETTLQKMVDKKVSVVPTTILANLYTLLDLAEPIPKGLLSRRAYLEAPIREAYLASVTEADVEPAIHHTNLAMLETMQKYPFSELYTRGDYTFNPHQYLPILTHGRQNLMRMKEAGIRIGCGTDAGVPLNYHGTIVRELQCMARLGFTNAEALTCATLNNAHILGMENEAGTLAPGKRADVITMAKNPVKDLAALNDLTLIVKNGTVYEKT